MNRRTFAKNAAMVLAGLRASLPCEARMPVGRL